MERNRIGHIISLLTILTVLSFQYSCQEEVPTVLENTVFTLEPASLQISSSNIKFNTYERTSLNVTVKSTNVDWEFANIPDWISISPSSGYKNQTKTVTISCNENTSVNDRIGFVTFRSKGSDWNYSTNITVTQLRSVYEAIPETDSIGFSWTASQAIVRINANNDEWVATPQGNLSEWCTIKRQRGAIEINCSENPSVNSRSGYLTVSTLDGSRVVKIFQSGIKVGVNVEENDSVQLNFSDKAGTSYIYINTYSKVQWRASTTDDWISISPTQGKGSGMIGVSVSGNSYGPVRVGTIKVQAYDYVQEVKVIQNGKYMNIDSPSLSFNSRGGEIILSLKSNDGWWAESDAEWMTLSETYGDGDCNILLTVDDNNSLYERTGNVTIRPYIALPVVLNVKQTGRYLTLSDSSKIVFGHGGIASKVITVDTDGEFEVTSSSEYVVVQIDNRTVTLSMTDFDATAPIEGSVWFSLKDLPEGVTLNKEIPFVLYGINREAVDMGLSVKWATCNVGALQSHEVGDYYAWGEIEPYYESGYAQFEYPVWKNGKTGYNWLSYKYCNGSASSITKYTTSNSISYYDYNNNDASYDGKTILEMEDDVAHLEWGETWRIPTREQFDELINNCNWTWTAIDGVKGYKITSRMTGYTSRSIFIPATGYRSDNSIYSANEYGYYWSNSLNESTNYNAWMLYLYVYGTYIDANNRKYGMAIRPVCMLDETEFTKIELSSEEKRVILGEECKLTVTAYKKDGNTIAFTGAEWSSSNNWVATVSDGTVKAISEGTCTITAKYGSHYDECTIVVIDPNSVTPEYVDLGLSVKWASFNLGAYSPEMYGDYFAWGEIETRYESGYAQSENPVWKNNSGSGYSWENYYYCENGVETSLTKYCNNGGYGKNGMVDNRVVLELSDDAAYNIWGGNWRIPTKDEFEELQNNCDWKWTIQDGVKGIKVTSKVIGYTNQSIFLPAAGMRNYTSLYDAEVYGYYWCSTLYDDRPTYAVDFYFSSGSDYCWSSNTSRCLGLPIRPVRGYSSSDFDSIAISPSSLNILEGYSTQIYANGVMGTNSISLSNVEWKTDNALVATVINGMVTAVGAGTCTITATYNDGYGVTKEGYCRVTVKALNKEDFILTDNLYLVVNDYIDGVRYAHNSPRIVTDPMDYENKCVMVTTNQSPENNYDAQLFIVLKGDLMVGDVLTISFRTMADYTQTCSTEGHSSPGEYVSGNSIPSVAFETEWSTYTATYTVKNERIRVFAIDLSKLSQGNNCYFDDISIINSRTGTGSSDDFVATGTYASHDYVDLGLSVKWAVCNLGAQLYFEVGDFYSWGETVIKHSYDWENYSLKLSGDSYSDVYLSKYNTGHWDGYRDDLTTLEMMDDAANASWGGEWRMPTREEFMELYTNCAWTQTEQNGITGYVVSSRVPGYTNRYIFIPSAGYRENTTTYKGGWYYWSSSLNTERETYAWNFHFDTDPYYYVIGRYIGASIRPVFPSEGWFDNFSFSLDVESVTVPISGHVTLKTTTKKGETDVNYPVIWSSGWLDVATVDENGVVTGVSPGTTTITATCHGQVRTCMVTVKDLGVGYVDLGLSVKWAPYNVGASDITEYGDYYAWGENVTKSTYYSTNYKWGVATSDTWITTMQYTKYSDSVDGKTELDNEDDAASFNWGDGWRMPTADEFQELLDYCEWEWTNLDDGAEGIEGYLVVSNINGNSIFLPAAGRKYQNGVSKVGQSGRYASRSCSSSGNAYGLYFESGSRRLDTYNREYGYSIRAVYP